MKKSSLITLALIHVMINKVFADCPKLELKDFTPQKNVPDHYKFKLMRIGGDDWQYDDLDEEINPLHKTNSYTKKEIQCMRPVEATAYRLFGNNTERNHIGRLDFRNHYHDVRCKYYTHSTTSADPHVLPIRLSLGTGKLAALTGGGWSEPVIIPSPTGNTYFDQVFTKCIISDKSPCGFDSFQPADPHDPDTHPNTGG